MINYTPQNQQSLDMFKHPFETKLDDENRWVKLSELIPWDDLAKIYSQKLQHNSGRKSVDIRTVIAALIVKHKLNLDDRGTIEMIKENIYLQYFCGLNAFTTKAIFDPSLFVNIRKRLGLKEFDEFNKVIIEKSETIKPHQGRIKQKGDKKNKDDDEKITRDSDKHHNADSQNDKDGLESSSKKNKGTLKVDATIADQEMKYPNDVGLLNQAREEQERIIDTLYLKEIDKEKPRTYRRNARNEYLSFSKKKSRSNKIIRKALKSQLQYVKRNIKTIDKMLAHPIRKHKLSTSDMNLLDIIKKLYEQQKWMYDNKKHSVPNRIVSLYQSWVRPMVRGKDRHKVEFGAKIDVSEVNGFSRIGRLEWEAFNEGEDVEMMVESYYDFYGCYPKTLLADKIYLTRKNRKYLKEKGIKTSGKPLGRPPKNPTETPSQKNYKRKKNAERNHVEGKFGQGKRAYGLNNIKARLQETSESWIGNIIFVMNLVKLIQIAEKYGYIFVQFLKHLYLSIKYHFKYYFANPLVNYAA